MGRIIAIDYGTKRVGLAVTDTLKIIATGLTTVDTPKIIPYLTDYVQKEPVELFVVGEPANWDGSPTDATMPANRFIKQLRKTFPDIPIDREDEQFTSKLAMQALIASGVKKKKRRNKALLDKISAVIILQSYMQRKGL